jgi:hypothetical protein
MKTFGASAPLKELQKKFGFQPDKVVLAAKRCWARLERDGRRRTERAPTRAAEPRGLRTGVQPNLRPKRCLYDPAKKTHPKNPVAWRRTTVTGKHLRPATSEQQFG